MVEIDPKEKNLRKVLNFGHTVGHAVESEESLGGLLHGECVAIGMMPMCSKEVRERLGAVLGKYSLPTHTRKGADTLISYIRRDKKAKGENITVIYVDKIGTFEMREIKIEDLKEYIDGGILK